MKWPIFNKALSWHHFEEASQRSAYMPVPSLPSFSLSRIRANRIRSASLRVGHICHWERMPGLQRHPIDPAVPPSRPPLQTCPKRPTLRTGSTSLFDMRGFMALTGDW